jgi:hypothetical protein
MITIEKYSRRDQMFALSEQKKQGDKTNFFNKTTPN